MSKLATVHVFGVALTFGWAVAACGVAATPTAATAQGAIATAPAPMPASASTAAPDTPAPDTRGSQISAWIREGDDGSVEQGSGPDDQPALRRIHGEVSAGIGSGGYRGVSGVADIPVGQSSDLIVGASRDSFEGRNVRGSRQSLSVGLFLNGATASTGRCDGQGQGQGRGGYGRPGNGGLRDPVLDGFAPDGPSRLAADGRPDACGSAGTMARPSGE